MGSTILHRICFFTDNFFYEFYEWTKTDNLVNVKKIPCVFVDKEVLHDLIHFNVRIGKEFLRSIENKSIFLRKDKNKYFYSIIIIS